METLTIKELAPYLPYGVHLMNEYGKWHNTTLHEKISIYRMLEMKLLLRPLSDLTKPITHNGETFVPMEKLCNDFCNRTPCNPEFGTSKILMHADNGGGLKWWFVYHRNKMTFELSDDNRDMSNHTIPQYEMFQKLFEWHFDVFGLISRNLAIDINNHQNKL